MDTRVPVGRILPLERAGRFQLGCLSDPRTDERPGDPMHDRHGERIEGIGRIGRIGRVEGIGRIEGMEWMGKIGTLRSM